MRYGERPDVDESPDESDALKIRMSLNERDIFKLILEFLESHGLNISQLDVERESGVVNAAFSDDLLFLRQLILDGQWDDALSFINPINSAEPSFDLKQFTFIIMKHQFIELLCLRDEADCNKLATTEQLAVFLNDIKQFCPTDEDFKQLCMLQSASRLNDLVEFKDWNPSSGRLACFEFVRPLVEAYLTTSNNISVERVSSNDRLLQLVVKGLLYEACVEYCQARATCSQETYDLRDSNVLLNPSQLSETDASLLSWLHALPIETFGCPFEEKPLELGMSRFEKPSLETNWSSAILCEPIKPSQLFPYSAVPKGRPRITELLFRSLTSKNDNLPFLSRPHIQRRSEEKPLLESMGESKLFREYQKNKAQMRQKLEEREKKRDEQLIKQLHSTNLAQSVMKSKVEGKNCGEQKLTRDCSLSPALSSSPASQVIESTLTSKLRAQPETNGTSKSPINLSVNRSINDALKSLEDITKAAQFLPISVIEDSQALRAVDVHPTGNFYVVGSNSKQLRVCAYPSLAEVKSAEQHLCKPASVVYKKGKHHYGSIYCVAWNPAGNLIATGSNDKSIKLISFRPDLVEVNDTEMEIACHNGTIRDMIFMHQGESNILVSGGAGDCKIQVTDCQTQQAIRAYGGHTGNIYSLFSWPTTQNVFLSGSQDKSVRFWDLRSPDAIQVVSPSQTSPVAAVAVDPTGLLLSTGHEDASCCLFDIRGNRLVQTYKPHSSDVRSVRFSANAYYLLTASYDNKVVITDLHGDLSKPLSWSVVANHSDKIIQARWHPVHMSFVTTSADRTSIVWSLQSQTLSNNSHI